MRFENGRIFTPTGFRLGGFTVNENTFSSVLEPEKGGSSSVDLHGAYVLPGLVDLHTHGNTGHDFSDGDPEGLEAMAGYLAAHGVTSFVPTSMTLPPQRLAAAFQSARQVRESRRPDLARVLGVHMEGPFFSLGRRGAQNAAYLREPDWALFQTLDQGCGNLIRLVDLAPEREGAISFIRKAAPLHAVALAHTDASYEAARAAFEAGACHLTHLFNAMPPLLHREPGVIGAASERENVTAELICDGLHVHPSAVRAAFRLFPGRICLVSDALRCCGMPEGEYELGGQRVWLKGKVARLADGTLAGSASNLFSCLKNAIDFGIPPVEAVLAATETPARVVGAEEQVGSIRPGRFADFLVCGSDWTLREVYLGGRRLERDDPAESNS